MVQPSRVWTLWVNCFVDRCCCESNGGLARYIPCPIRVEVDGVAAPAQLQIAGSGVSTRCDLDAERSRSP